MLLKCGRHFEAPNRKNSFPHRKDTGRRRVRQARRDKKDIKKGQSEVRKQQTQSQGGETDIGEAATQLQRRFDPIHIRCRRGPHSAS